MGPLSAIAVAGWLVVFGVLNVGTFSAASTHTLGWVALVAAALVVLDVFVLGHFRRRPGPTV